MEKSSVARRLLGTSLRAAGRGARRTGSGLQSGARALANVPAGQKYFAKPRHYVTRPLRSALFPNLGTWGNRVRLLGTGAVTGAGGYKAYQNLQPAATKVRQQKQLVQDPTAQTVLDRWDTVPDMLWNSMRGFLPKATPDQEIVGREVLNKALDAGEHVPYWSGRNVDSYVAPMKEVAVKGLTRFLTNTAPRFDENELVKRYFPQGVFPPPPPVSP